MNVVNQAPRTGHDRDYPGLLGEHHVHLGAAS